MVGCSTRALLLMRIGLRHQKPVKYTLIFVVVCDCGQIIDYFLKAAFKEWTDATYIALWSST